MRVLVCGGRRYEDRDEVARQLDPMLAAYPTLAVICGYDPDVDRYQGADQLAYEWAKARGVPVFAFPAAWHRHGLAAGPIRNQRMLDDAQPDEVLAFPGGRGTEDMAQRARGRGVHVERVPRPGRFPPALIHEIDSVKLIHEIDSVNET